MKSFNQSNQKSFKLSELIQGLEVSVIGDPDCIITGISPIHHSLPGHITFLNNPTYRKFLLTTQASAVILSEEDAKNCPVMAVIATEPYYIYSQVAQFFKISHLTQAGIHASAVIGAHTQIHETVSIGPNCVIGDHVVIHQNVVIKAGTVIGASSEIGAETLIEANVTIYPKIKIGKRTGIESGVVIGSDGFGFSEHRGAWHKVPQLGSVIIGDDVEIGANTTIDRGALEDTVIGNGVKLDNLIQIAHNVSIGEYTIIAGCVGIAGSTKIGKHCMIGGGSRFAGHITICDHAIITGTTGVEKSILEPGVYASGVVGAVLMPEFRKNNARFYRLEKLMSRVKQLEATVKEMREKSV